MADRCPDDPDAQVLAAEAMMLLSPWDYWTEAGEPKPGTEELLGRLRPVTETYPAHAGARNVGASPTSSSTDARV